MTLRGGDAAVVGVDLAERVVPLTHYVHPYGTASLVLDENHPLVAQVALAPRDELPAMLELIDHAPVKLRQPTRGLLWLSGVATGGAPAASARRVRLDHGRRRAAPEPARQRPWCDPAAALPRERRTRRLRGAPRCSPPNAATHVRPDPFAGIERGWLRHLEEAHPEVFSSLRRHLPSTFRALADARIRPLGVDRYGLRLRLEGGDGDHDVRLAFEHPVETVEGLRTQVGLLVGCPLRGGALRRSESG